MSGLNDLASTLRADTAFQAKGDYRAASLVDETARTAWHPVSEPPTEADGDHLGRVAVWWIEEELFGTMHYRVAPVSGPNLLWARIRDVVLLPSHDEGGSDE